MQPLTQKEAEKRSKEACEEMKKLGFIIKKNEYLDQFLEKWR